MRQVGQGGPALEPYAADRYQSKTPFFYNTGIPAALAAAGTTQSTFNIDADADFFVTKLTGFAMVADDGTVVDSEQLPAIALLITNTQSGRAYSNEFVPAPNIVGSARLPFLLPAELFWPAKATILVQYQNISDNLTYSDFELTFAGYKAYT